MMTVPFEFDAWSRFALDVESDFSAVITRGGAANDLLSRQCEKIASSAEIGSIDEHEAWIVNAPYTHASDVGELLAARPGPGVAVVWRYMHSKHVLVASLRSSPSAGVDVATIAEVRGGGGHARAASFSMRVGLEELPLWCDVPRRQGPQEGVATSPSGDPYRPRPSLQRPVSPCRTFGWCILDEGHRGACVHPVGGDTH